MHSCSCLLIAFKSLKKKGVLYWHIELSKEVYFYVHFNYFLWSTIFSDKLCEKHVLRVFDVIRTYVELKID